MLGGRGKKRAKKKPNQSATERVYKWMDELQNQLTDLLPYRGACNLQQCHVAQGFGGCQQCILGVKTLLLPGRVHPRGKRHSHTSEDCPHIPTHTHRVRRLCIKPTCLYEPKSNYYFSLNIYVNKCWSIYYVNSLRNSSSITRDLKYIRTEQLVSNEVGWNGAMH